MHPSPSRTTGLHGGGGGGPGRAERGQRRVGLRQARALRRGAAAAHQWRRAGGGAGAGVQGAGAREFGVGLRHRRCPRRRADGARGGAARDPAGAACIVLWPLCPGEGGDLWCTVSTDYFQVNVNVHSVYKLCKVSTNYAKCLQTMQSVYKLCAVSTDYSQVNVNVHSVYKLCKVSTNYAQCLQTIPR